MLYNNSIEIDVVSIIQVLDDFSKSIGIEGLTVDSNAIYRTCINMREDFPCKNGLENASVFKRSAVFITEFIKQSPLESDGFAKSNLSSDLKSRNPNSIIAFYISLLNITNSNIFRSDGSVVTVENPLEISKHSFIDILDMLDHKHFHFMSLSLLLEQITYKTNSTIQYPENMLSVGKPVANSNLPEPSYVESLTPAEVLEKFNDLPAPPSFDQQGFGDPANSANF